MPKNLPQENKNTQKKNKSKDEAMNKETKKNDNIIDQQLTLSKNEGNIYTTVK